MPQRGTAGFFEAYSRHAGVHSVTCAQQATEVVTSVLSSALLVSEIRKVLKSKKQEKQGLVRNTCHRRSAVTCFHIGMGRSLGKVTDGAFGANQLGGRQCVSPDFSGVAWWHYC